MLDKYISLLKAGDVVAFPTETVYGLGADAWNPDAIKKVFATKGRPSDNPLIVHISNRGMVKDFTAEIPEAATLLMDAFWPGPLTLIFKKKSAVPDIATGGLSTVALRWPNHPLSQELIERSGPLVAPSANTSGRPSPTRPEHVKQDFGTEFPVIEAGETEIGLESTVLDVSQLPFCVYRPGAVSREDIQKVTGQKVVEALPAETGSVKSPGTKYTHYAPKASVRWLKEHENPDEESTLYLYHSSLPKVVNEHIITYGGDYSIMAKELYDRFRQADYQQIKEIVIEPFSENQLEKVALATALKNRISKAVT